MNSNCYLNKLERKRIGSIYTPSLLSDYVSEKTAYYFFKSNKKISNTNQYKLSIVDPACGNGQLLLSLNNVLQNIYIDNSPLNNIEYYGFDIDKKAINNAKKYFNIIKYPNAACRYFNKDSLAPDMKTDSFTYWKDLLIKFNLPLGFDILIANPPWGSDFEEDILNSIRKDFSLATGQFDSADLFVELALHIVRPGGIFSFILPDSLFNNERRVLRGLLLKNTQIMFISRLGERIFKDVNRACSIIICKNTTNNITKRRNLVDCFRLHHGYRNNILNNKNSLKEADSLFSHKVSQDRFFNNADYAFDIDLKSYEEKLINIICNSYKRFKTDLKNYRGVELSKSGKVIRCEECGMWLPRPRRNKPTCSHCGFSYELAGCLSDVIVTSEPSVKSVPLITGEDVKRYHIINRKFLRIDYPGIQYKDSTIYNGPKLLIRKTGVGITAAIDYSNSFTNQVVYIFKLKDKQNNFPLELYLGILNSRLMYFYMAKKFGETEWRSHPYLTQKQILDIPFPPINSTNCSSKTILWIEKIIKDLHHNDSQLTPEDDARLESYVANLYGINKNEYKYIYDLINTSQDLIPLKPLRQVSISDIF